MILAVINAIYSTAQKNLKNEHFSPKVFFISVVCCLFSVISSLSDMCCGLLNSCTEKCEFSEKAPKEKKYS